MRATAPGNSFWQIAGGVEALHPNWDLRANVYAPITAPKQAPGLAEVRLAGNQIFMVGGKEVPLYGVDAEIGVRLPLEQLGIDSFRHQLRVYAGLQHA